MKRVRISEMTPQERVDFAIANNYTLGMCERYNVDLELLTASIAKAKVKLTIESLRADLVSVDKKLSMMPAKCVDVVRLREEKNRLESIMNDTLSEYQSIVQK